MKYTVKNTSGYSIIAAVLMIGFLILLTTSTLNLALQEMIDGKGRQNYLKAFGGAEGGLELALLRIKQEGFGYDEDNFEERILGTDRTNGDIRYSFDSRVNTFSGVLAPYETSIIPLFHIDSNGVIESVSGVNLSVIGDATWNIIGKDTGISGSGSFLATDTKLIRRVTSASTPSQIDGFLQTNTGSYLSIYNSRSIPSNYVLTGVGTNKDFSKPISTIYSTSKVGKYSQNLKTEVNNSEFLGILKYSIFSSN